MPGFNNSGYPEYIEKCYSRNKKHQCFNNAKSRVILGMIRPIDWECEFYEFKDFLKFKNFYEFLKMVMNFKNRIRHCKKLRMR